MSSHSKENKSTKVNTTLIGIVALLAIFAIVWIANDTHNINNITSNTDVYGQASAVIIENIPDTALCRLIIGQSEAYDNTNLVTGLQTGSSTYYSGNNIIITSINSNGCQIDINGNTDYIAVGQIQKVGQVYVTVKGISK